MLSLHFCLIVEYFNTSVNFVVMCIVTNGIVSWSELLSCVYMHLVQYTAGIICAYGAFTYFAASKQLLYQCIA